MTRSRLLFVATEDWYFISDTLPLARAALAAGYDVHVAARANGHEGKIRAAGLTFHALSRMERAGIGFLSQAASLHELRALIRRLAPQVVHNIALKPTLYGLLAARDAQTIAVVNAIMGLGFVFASDSAKARILRLIVWPALKQVVRRSRSLTLLQNSDDLELLAALHPEARGKLRLVKGSGVDATTFTVTPPPEGPPTVVLAGRLLVHKGVAEFAEAARILKQRGINARFILVGDPDEGNHASVSRADLTRWTSEGILEHWGFRSDMPKVYEAASVFCLPTYYREGLPRVLLEAAACGRPLVATDVPGCREIVRPGINGWLVEPRNAEALADALQQAIGDAPMRARYGSAGRRMIEQEFAAPLIIAQTLAYYEDLLQDR